MANLPFDPVPLAVARLVERLLRRLVLAGRDHRFHVTLPCPAPDVRVTIPLVARQLGRPIRVTPTPGEQDSPEQGLEGRRFMPLARSDVDAQHDAPIRDQ